MKNFKAISILLLVCYLFPSCFEKKIQQNISTANQLPNTNNANIQQQTYQQNNTATHAYPNDNTHTDIVVRTFEPLKPIPNNNKSDIQIAILLDTSGSMEGLIEQAKAQIWKMVNELTRARDNKNEQPQIQIALYHYGNDAIPSQQGYIQQLLPLNTDLDLVSAKLFALTTNGGEEYCGYAIHTAINELQWCNENDDLRIIFICGNEPFTQGPFNYLDACKEAKAKDIYINTIHCGEQETGIADHWKDGATCGNGKFVNINMNKTVVQIQTPQDDKINELNNELNKTYLWYGNEGKQRSELQKIQDSNAKIYGGSNLTNRAISKASKSYQNNSYDLVDAISSKTIDLKKINDTDLPDEMKKLSIEEREKYVIKKAEERKNLQTQIQNLDVDRRKYIAEKEKELAATDTTKTLDNAIINLIREQAKNKKFIFVN